jgi:hypothetical protein
MFIAAIADQQQSVLSIHWFLLQSVLAEELPGTPNTW